MKDTSLNRLAFTATVHCLTGCAIGEVRGIAPSAAFPVNRWLVSQGREHAVLHHYHGHGTH
jgi:hypothetical protein